MYDLAQAAILHIAEKGATDYRILVGENASASVRHAAEELQYFLREMSGAVLPICDDREEFQEKSIVLGECSALNQVGCVYPEGLGDEGFVLRTVGQTLLILGSQVRGVLYGVYTLLEKYFGCRWFTPDVSRIPHNQTLKLCQIDDRQVPVLEYRDPYHMGYLQAADWHARNKCNGNQPPLTEKHGGKMAYCKYFVHSFDNLVPVEAYFDTHPEYFSEVNGVRVREKTQLCLTNEDVFQISLERIRGWIRENPEARIVTVSVNDCFNPCQCEKCRAVNDREESQAGTLIQFVNRLAEEITKEYPDILIDTLSYLYTRKAPKYLHTHPNVIVRVCTIECCFSHPLEACTAMGSFNLEESARPNFAQDLINWSKCSQRMYVWDYVTNFENFLQPFPNFKTLQPNLQFYIRNGVKGVFYEGYTTFHECSSGELDQMRMYVMAKLLWDPQANVDMLVNEFLAGYYGQAAPWMRAYYDLLHKQTENKEWHLGVYDPPTKPYLNDEMLDQASLLFDEAERAAEDETVRARVRRSRLSITHTILAKMPADTPGRAEQVDALFDEIASFDIRCVTEHYPAERSRMRLKQGRLHIHNQ